MNYLSQVFRTVRNQSPILYTIVMIHFIAAIVCAVGLLIDDRMLMGVNVWLKPLKFAISGAIYIMTVGFFMTLYPFSTRKKNILNNLVSWTLFLEGALIMYQASRGVASHYNESSLFDGLLFAAMGILIGINVLVMILFIIETMRLKLNTSKAIQFAILLGWIIIVVGSWVGGQMISQMSHNVGIVDGGAGLPLVNWSTLGGDLRIAHFFGLHGIQVIPLFAFLLHKKWKTSSRNQILSVTVFGLGYASWIAFVYYQASQGIPLIG
ncbi:MAG: hypothetical protein ACSHWW_06355 [Nonlabens sp.]|uniref:hypothetical protein n=1 Tax=Nonlabens sp. TaxID=1888209 RepID=UPI003EF98076